MSIQLIEVLLQDNNYKFNIKLLSQFIKENYSNLSIVKHSLFHYAGNKECRKNDRKTYHFNVVDSDRDSDRYINDDASYLSFTYVEYYDENLTKNTLFKSNIIDYNQQVYMVNNNQYQSNQIRLNNYFNFKKNDFISLSMKDIYSSIIEDGLCSFGGNDMEFRRYSRSGNLEKTLLDLSSSQYTKEKFNNGFNIAKKLYKENPSLLLNIYQSILNADFNELDIKENIDFLNIYQHDFIMSNIPARFKDTKFYIDMVSTYYKEYDLTKYFYNDVILFLLIFFYYNHYCENSIKLNKGTFEQISNFFNYYNKILLNKTLNEKLIKHTNIKSKVNKI